MTPSRLAGSQPYLQLIHTWFYYDYQTTSNRAVPDSVSLRMRCVAEDAHRTCGSGVLEFSDTVTQETDEGYLVYLNIRGAHTYHQVEGLYSNHRPVYKRNMNDSGGTVYLHQVSDYWLIGNDLGVDLSFMSVKSLALRPELIDATWRALTKGSFQQTDVRLRCHGHPTNVTCSDVTCQNGGTCYTEDHAVLCACARGYEGVSCERELPSCALPEFPPHTLNYIIAGRSLGAVGTFTCENGYEPHHIYSVCAGTGNNPAWQAEGSCQLDSPPRTTRSSWSSWSSWSQSTHSWSTWSSWDPTPEPMSQSAFLDGLNSWWTLPVILILVLLVQTLLSPILGICVKQHANTKKVDRAVDNIVSNNSTKLQEVREFS